MESLEARLTARVAATLVAGRPRSIHVVGLANGADESPAESSLVAAIRGAGGPEPRSLGWAALADTPLAAGQAAFAWLGDPLVALDARLGELCRRYPAALVVAHAVDTRSTNPPRAARFFAFGFERLRSSDTLPPRNDGVEAVAVPAWRAYRYRLHDYKAVPDWLNARYWANPERFHLDPDETT